MEKENYTSLFFEGKEEKFPYFLRNYTIVQYPVTNHENNNMESLISTPPHIYNIDSLHGKLPFKPISKLLTK